MHAVDYQIEEIAKKLASLGIDYLNLTDKTYEAAIKKLAYSKWQKAGSPLGRDLVFWLEAEREFKVLEDYFRPDWNLYQL